jgi:hypothetical protein
MSVKRLRKVSTRGLGYSEKKLDRKKPDQKPGDVMMDAI